MIDFRYHVVSIVSIFLALAVGIVLGAGPLQGRLGDTLSKEVSGLRKDRVNLNTQLRDVTANMNEMNRFVEATTPALVTNRLSAHSVTIVRLPGSSDDVAKNVTDELTEAGATVHGTVKITKVWTDPTKAQFRDDLAKSLAPLARSQPPTGAAQDQGLAAVLARGLVVADVSAAGRPDSGATTALQSLKTAGLIDYSGTEPEPSTLAVVVAGPPTPNESSDLEKAEATSYAVVARALDAQSSGAVAVSDPTGADDGGTLDALRSDKQASQDVSTVDDADQPMGLVTLILAFREQLNSHAGQYGVGSGATKIMPDLAAL
ncbi:MAG: copper transporter [Actinomycetales bacterium]